MKNVQEVNNKYINIKSSTTFKSYLLQLTLNPIECGKYLSKETAFYAIGFFTSPAVGLRCCLFSDTAWPILIIYGFIKYMFNLNKDNVCH
jgi:hypothetical protein